MKRVGFLWEKVIDPDNVRTAIVNASRRKRHRKDVQRVLERGDAAVREIIEVLEHGFTASPYRKFSVIDKSSGKSRDIMQPRFFPDQVVHWALIQVAQPVLMRGMYYHSVGSVPGRGSGHAVRVMKRWLRRDARRTKWCLKLDIEKFYPSIDHDVLKAKLRRVFKDARFLELFDAIIDSAPGLPIGNFTSQWLANYYLQSLDHWMTAQSGVAHYVRYVDDLVILGPAKRALHRVRSGLADFLGRLGLRIKASSWQVFRVSDRGVDFVGFRFFHDRTVLRRRLSLRIARRCRRISRRSIMAVCDARAFMAYWGFLRHSDSRWYYANRVRPFVRAREARFLISAADLAA